MKLSLLTEFLGLRGRRCIFKRKAGLVIICVALILATVSVWTLVTMAETDGPYTYTVSGGTANIIEVNKNIDGDVVIPDTLGGYPVTVIWGCAFSDCVNLTSVTIPASVITLTADFSSYCVFFNCPNLTAIHVADDNEYFTSDNGVLFNKDKTVLIQCPEGKTGIYAIPDDVTGFALDAFRGCVNITEINIPDSLINVGGYVFRDCERLEAVNVGDGNPVLASVDGVLIDNINAAIMFYPYAKIGAFTIPTNVRYILSSAFSNGYYRQSGREGLTEITITGDISVAVGFDEYVPYGVTNDIASEFMYCPNLTAFHVADNFSTFYTAIDGVLFNKNMTELLAYPMGKFVETYSIPDGVTRIATCAFASCWNLTEIVFPDTLETIGEGAFFDCRSLGEVVLPDGVITIMREAFAWCSSLTSITIPRSVTYIYCSDDYNKFTDFIRTPNLTIKGYSGSYAQSFALYNGIPFIALDDDDLPQVSLTLLPGTTPRPAPYNPHINYVTEYKTGLVWDMIRGENREQDDVKYNLYLPTTAAGYYDFGVNFNIMWNSSDPTVIADNGVVTRPTNGSADKEVSLTATINSDSNSYGIFDLFATDTKTFNLIVPAYTSDYGEKVITFHTNTPDHILTQSEVTAQIDAAGLEEYECFSASFDSSVFGIGESAFSIRNGLVSVTIPEGVISIGSYSFGNSLTSVNIPASAINVSIFAFSFSPLLEEINVSSDNNFYSSDNGVWFDKNKTTLIKYPEGKSDIHYVVPIGVTTIGMEAFYLCGNLMSVELPEGLDSIERDAFSGCKVLSSVNVPDSVSNIDGNVFSYCPNLMSVNVIQSNKYFSSEDGVLFDKSMTTLIACPGGRAGKYIIPNNVKYIGNGAFSGCNGLLGVEIPNSVINIGSSAFAYCSGLVSVSIPDSVVSIGDFAFDACSSLLSVNIPDRVISIESYTFYGCTSLTSVNIPSGVTFIAEGAFSGCWNLKGVGIPNNVTSIGAFAFDDCMSLTSVNIPYGVTSIS